MKITDKTNQKSDNRTFKVGDVVKGEHSNGAFTYLHIARINHEFCQAFDLSDGDRWNDAQRGDSFTFEKTSWKYTKVNAELIITD
jgi:hypothetical protein